jgi:hypothetical protein
MLTPEECTELDQAIKRAQDLYATGLARMSVGAASRHYPTPEPAPSIENQETPTSEVESANHLKAADPVDENTGPVENHNDDKDNRPITTTDLFDGDEDTNDSHETGSRENPGTTDGANQPTEADENRPETLEQGNASDGEGNGPDADAQNPVTGDKPSPAVQAAMLAAMMANPTVGEATTTTTTTTDQTQKDHGDNPTQRQRSPRRKRG